MRSKSILLLALAIGCGLVASIGISQVMDRDRPQAAETEPVFVAAADINPNDLITPQLIKLEDWPKGKVPAGAVTKLEDVEGKRCRQKLYAGEPVIAGKLRGQGDDMLPSDGIPKGYRVVNVRVDSVSGTGLIVPGDRVDVLVFLNKNPSAGISESSTRTILQDIKVYAVDATFVGKQENNGALVSGKTVSLLVTPPQAEKVTLASELGNVRLVIRSLDDDLESTSTGASVVDIFGTDKNSAEREQMSSTPDAYSAAAIVKPVPVAPLPLEEPPAHPWKMVLVEGSVMRTVDFTEDSSVPIFEPPVNEPPVNDTPATDAPAAAPGEPAADPATSQRNLPAGETADSAGSPAGGDAQPDTEVKTN